MCVNPGTYFRRGRNGGFKSGTITDVPEGAGKTGRPGFGVPVVLGCALVRRRQMWTRYDI